jgi:carboxyl-terminal processing protease
VSTGYGAEFVLIRTTPPRRAVVAYVEPNSPAAAANVTRGMEVLAIDGVDFVNDNSTSGVQLLQRALAPTVGGQSFNFTFRPRSGTGSQMVALTSAAITSTPVLAVRQLPGNVGYVLFNSHIATSERGLAEAFVALRNAAVTDLVLDLRYNGGGLLGVASELSYMIGGTRVAGKTFERLQFNSKYPSTNPVIGGALAPTPFFDRTQGYSLASGQALPTLSLARVFVLTSADTCSASESIINGLSGAGVQVIQIGETTCGKPYGFYPTDNCGTTYFSIQFRGLNEAGFGDYVDGFSPVRTTGDARANLRGCEVADDFSRELGDAGEARLAAALTYAREGRCPVGVRGSDAGEGPRVSAAQESGEGLPVRLPETPWKDNRILDPARR